MIDKKELVNYLMNWRASLGKTFQDDVISIVLDIILKKVESFDCEQEHSYSTMMLYEIADVIEDAPTVDAVPVVRGKWLYNDFIKEWECSNCHSSISLSDDRNSHPNFCPNCGADMRKKVE